MATSIQDATVNRTVKLKKKKSRKGLSEPTSTATPAAVEEPPAEVSEETNNALSVEDRKARKRALRAARRGTQPKPEDVSEIVKGKKRKPEAEEGDEDGSQAEKPRKKRRKNRTEFADPRVDEDLPEQARRALEYAFLQMNKPEKWKFNKARQNWLLRNVWNPEMVSDTYFPLVVKYFSLVQGGTRERLTQTCGSYLKEEEEKTEKEDEKKPEPATPAGETTSTPRSILKPTPGPLIAGPLIDASPTEATDTTTGVALSSVPKPSLPPPSMLDDELKVVAMTAFKTLITSQKLKTPTSSMDLLTNVITTKMPSELLPTSPAPKFRLTDLSRFERIIEDLANTWADGFISFSRDEASGGMMIWDLGLHALASRSGARPLLGAGAGADSQSTAQSGGSGGLSGFVSSSRKRKRVIDEDADSAAGDDETLLEDEDVDGASGSPLANLSAEMREVYNILQKSTAKGRLLAEQFRSREENFNPICSHITKDDCAKARRAAYQDQSQNGASSSSPPSGICDRVHFRPLIRPHTDVTLGHCSYLNTCYSEPTYSQSPSIPAYPGSTTVRGPISLPSGLGAGGRGKEKAPCRYLHYEIDWDGGDGDWKAEKRPKKKIHRLNIGLGPTGKITKPLPPQWINCDLRTFDYSTLGKFHVIMADPPWDIHMSLPYGTMNDDEMRKMPIPMLQDEGFLFLWVTGRAMEVGRECMKVWGYTRIDEVVWVKTNQLQRVIRTGRTGHWLNHTKEHMLVGVKTVLDANGNLKFPSWANRALDTDVIVSEVRETSRKPDEVYGLIERLCPGGRKVEIFGRKHNVRPGWLTLGNQLGPDQIFEEDLAARVKAKYPDRPIKPPPSIQAGRAGLPKPPVY
ncbi:hypothetical protein CVT26_008509 [Gymnopilus dilepis]|uniref:mRNA m(6)A methyltransferase n=1 Tax=Gymnopilus dilepis TaxID=231916 RepID=A0A409XXN9_9AGAR|nr:hypothetical protein CVT26_008509 [Gymnopilus dilepis]